MCRALKALSAGYFLSVIHALVFAFPIPLLYAALATYPFSIALRGYGWRVLRQRLGIWGALHLPIWVLGAATYAAILLQLQEIIDFGLYVALACWASYSLAEALLYLRAAKVYRFRALFFSPISLVGVAIVASLVIMPSSNILQPAEGAPLVANPLILGAAATLTASAMITGIQSLGLRATREELSAGLQIAPAAAPRPPTPAATRVDAGPTAKATVAVTSPAATGPLLRIEVMSRSDVMLCSSCGESSPVGAERCRGCGTPFRKASSGLRCPVCKAPFSAVRMVSRGHYVCGQCFSDLRVS
jgi:ribosomal protein L40E